MKNIACGLIFAVTTITGSNLAKAEECYWDGYQLGIMEADSFCDVWERMYNDDVVVMPYSMHSKLANMRWPSKPEKIIRCAHG
jgi:hypothetical protein